VPFFLYRLEGNDYVRARGKNVTLAGLSGPFCRSARRVPTNPEWELTEPELLRSFGVDPTQHAVVIDLKPSNRVEVSLYRLKHVWGYSANHWTRLAWELETLYGDYTPPNGASVKDFKVRFSALSAPGDQIYEFLYLNGDASDGAWAFGRVGSVNAPLLSAEVLDSFIKRINRKRIETDHLPPLGVVDLKAAA